jgi:hypothetical protein
MLLERNREAETSQNQRPVDVAIWMKLVWLLDGEPKEWSSWHVSSARWPKQHLMAGNDPGRDVGPGRDPGQRYHPLDAACAW